MDERLRNELSRHRTELANERTLLAYIRTALGFVIVGIPTMWVLEHPYLQALGGLSLAAGAVCLALGLRRFMAVKTLIARESDAEEEAEEESVQTKPNRAV